MVLFTSISICSLVEHVCSQISDSSNLLSGSFSICNGTEEFGTIEVVLHGTVFEFLCCSKLVMVLLADITGFLNFRKLTIVLIIGVMSLVEDLSLY